MKIPQDIADKAEKLMKDIPDLATRLLCIAKYTQGAMEERERKEWTDANIKTEGFMEGTAQALEWIASWRSSIEEFRKLLIHTHSQIHLASVQTLLDRFNELFSDNTKE